MHPYTCPNQQSKNNLIKIFLQLSYFKPVLQFIPYSKTKFGRSALHWACFKNQLTIVEMLVKTSTEFNIDLNSKDEHGRTAFHFSCNLR